MHFRSIAVVFVFGALCLSGCSTKPPDAALARKMLQAHVDGRYPGWYTLVSFEVLDMDLKKKNCSVRFDAAFAPTDNAKVLPGFMGSRAAESEVLLQWLGSLREEEEITGVMVLQRGGKDGWQLSNWPVSVIWE